MTKTGWIIFITVVVLGLGALITWTRITNPPLDVSDVNTASVIAAEERNGLIGDQVTGKKDSKVILVEYGDYQCPGCKGASTGVEKIIQEYGDRVAIVFRNFPITSIHPNAKAAASVAEAAGLQGKFWEMNAHLYQAQAEWSAADTKLRTDIFRGYAEALQLDMDKFNTDVAGAAVAKKLKFDQALAGKDSVTSTPTFLINGKLVSEESSSQILSGNIEAISKELDALLK